METDPEKVRAYVRRLENPYASLQVEGAEEYYERRAYLRRLENPYASLQVGVAEKQAPESKVQRSVTPQPLTGSLSKTEFEAQCRAILRSYMPELERSGPLRAHHRDFIARNVTRSAEDRFKLLQHLKRYDLSDVPALRSQFNREEDHFTEAKLKEIERLLDPGE